MKAKSPYTSNSFTLRPKAACKPIMQASYFVAFGGKEIKSTKKWNVCPFWRN